MKRIFILMLVLLVAFSICLSLSSCKKDTPKTEEPPVEEPPVEDPPKEDPKPSVDLSGLSFNNLTVIYDGTPKSITIGGALPQGVEVRYVGNGNTEVGTYTITARFYYKGEYVEDADISATLTITKASYDMRNVKFTNSEKTYDGMEFTPSLRGTLPDGVSVSFDTHGEELINAGTYTVTAKFTIADTQNYKEIPDMTATYTIKKADYDMKGISFSDAIKQYTGNEITPAVKGTLPDGVSVRYEVEGNKTIKDEGTYYITAIFVVNNENYNPIEPMTATYTVIDTRYDMSSVSFVGITKMYDGVEIIPSITGSLPSGVSVSYIVEGDRVIRNAGTYKVTAKFTVDSGDVELPNMYASFVIKRATYDTTDKLLSEVIDFDGQYHSLLLTDVPSAFTVTYEGNGVRSVGVHTVTVTFSADPLNCDIPEPITATITINRGSYSNSELTYAERSDGTYEVTGYTGNDDFIMIPEAYEGKTVTSIKSNAFVNNIAIAYVYIPDSVTNIGNNAFSGCTALAEFRISENLEVIGSQAFASTKITSIALPDTLKVIGQGAFAKTNLESITLPFIGGSHNSSNTYLGYIFGGYNENAVPTSLKTVIIGSACTEIPAYAFNGCSNVSTIVIGSGVKRIGNSAFANCTSLKYIYIPKTVTDIPADEYWYNSPFMNCSSELLIVSEGDYNSAYGQYWCYIAEGQRALTVYNKTYEDYMENKESYREIDMTDADATIIFLDGVALDGFAWDKYSYTTDADINLGYKSVTALPSSSAAAVVIEQASTANSGVATVTITSGDGNTVKKYTITFNITGTLNTSAEVVNKGGADAAVSFVIDDGNKTTGKFAKEMLEKYEELNFSFAVPAYHFATLTVDSETNEYVMADGKYTYTQTTDQISTVRFWTNLLNLGRCEMINHTYTHGFWGLNDDGGEFRYLKSDGETIVTSALMPKGSSSKEIYATNQLISELFPSTTFPSQYQMTFVHAGIGVYTSEKTIDGETFVPYSTYFNALLNDAMANGVFIGGRSTFDVRNTTSSASRVVTPEWMQSASNRLRIPGYMIVTENRNSTGSLDEGGIDNWLAFIDHAIEKGGLATYCIHYIKETVTDHSSHFISEADAEELFKYALDNNVWVAQFTDAVMYYSEWSTASVTSIYEDGKVKVTLTDSENDEVYNMALTVKVAVPATWTGAVCAGEALEIHENADGSHYVYVDIVPDSGAVEITAE